ncbi:NAD(P)-binding protein [Gloeopeniophorella convolvens]|nr:NAD(P)-binding protein [Gloeopeniophorella convolvens]
MTGVKSVLGQMFPPKPQWTAENIPDLTGKVAIVTDEHGVNHPIRRNTGVGKETVKHTGAKVYLAARSAGKGQAAIKELKEETGKEAVFLPLDLANLPVVRKGADEFLSGVMTCPKELLTEQGFDLQFGTNVIGYWFFVQLLLPALQAATANSPTHAKARVVSVSSSVHYLAKGIDFDAIMDGSARRKVASRELYVRSKFGNAVVACELARPVNPGNLKTELQRHASKLQTQYGAITQLYSATAPEAAEYNGQFLIPWARTGKAHPAALDPKIGAQLWDWLEENTKNY